MTTIRPDPKLTSAMHPKPLQKHIPHSYCKMKKQKRWKAIRNHITLQGQETTEWEDWAVMELNGFVIHPCFSSELKILIPLPWRTKWDIWKKGRHYMTFITVKINYRGRVIIIWRVFRKIILFLDFTHIMRYACSFLIRRFR